MTRFAPIDLARLPAPDVIEPLDFEVIFDALRDGLIAASPDLAPVLALESEPAVKVLQVIAWSKLHDRARVNDAARAVMLPYAVGANLDVLAALFGVPRAEAETDTRLRDRVRLALQAYSSAGPAGAYRYHAFTASPRVRDVLVDSPAPGQVRVVVMADDNAYLPDAALLASVTAAVTAEDVRVLTDQVSVVAATAVDFTVAAEITVTGAAASLVLAAAEASVLDHVANRRALGLRVTRSALVAALHVDGVEKVDLFEPVADIEPDDDAFARCMGVTLAEPGQAVPQ